MYIYTHSNKNISPRQTQITSPQKRPIMEWVRVEKIGQGSFGTVSLAKPSIQNTSFPPLVALKSCRLAHSASLKHEKSILDQFRDCPEVISCYGESTSFEYGQKVYNLYLEYASGGSLADMIKKTGGGGLSESNVRLHTYSVLQGLKRIHQSGYVHCDVKPDNLLVFAENDAVKIADFGLSKKAGEKRLGNSSCDVRGSPMYLSPETVITGEQEAPADIWAVGCVVAEMISGRPSWNCSDFAALLMKIGASDETPEIPAKLSEEGKDFLAKCFLKNPSQRWTAEMLLDHPFVAADQDCVAEDRVPSISPRCPFEFPDWEETEITNVPSPKFGFDFSELDSRSKSKSKSKSKSAASRMGEMMSTEQKLNWSDSSSSWLTVR